MMNGSPVLGVFLDEALDGITTIVSCIKTGGEGASIERLDARIREMRALVDKAGRTEPTGNA
jgi:hypothetical protein